MRALLVTFCMLWGLVGMPRLVEAASISTPAAGFDITVDGSTEAVGLIRLSANSTYLAVFEWEVTPGVWSACGGQMLMTTTAGNYNTNVKLGNWAAGVPARSGRIHLKILQGGTFGPVVNNAGTLRGPPSP